MAGCGRSGSSPRRPGELGTEPHDPRRVEAFDRIVAALDVVEVEGLAEGGKRLQERRPSARLPKEVLNPCYRKDA